MQSSGINRFSAKSTAILLVAIALISRIAAPWQLGITNDEMHHLKSWRNRYGTNDIYPMFIQRLEETKSLTPAKLARVKRIYAASPLIQRGLIVLVDPQPPTFPIMAEAIEWISNSSLIALRLPSALASLATIVIVFVLGRRLKDNSLGLWMAAMMTVGTLGQVYAGIGRPYALAQCGIAACLLCFVLCRQQKPASPWRLLVAAIIAQSLQWMAWSVVGPIALGEIICRFREGTPLRILIKQTAWYVVASVLLLGEMLVQLRNPTITGQSGTKSLADYWNMVCVSSPFAHFASFGHACDVCSGLLYLFFMVCGMISLTRRNDGDLAIRATLFGALLGGIVAMVLAGSSVRFMMTYAFMPTVFAAIGGRWLLHDSVTSNLTITALLAALGALTFFHPENPYDRIFGDDIPYEPVAHQLARFLGADSCWTAYPYYRANCLYRGAKLPVPASLEQRKDVYAWVKQRPKNVVYYLFVDQYEIAPVTQSAGKNASISVWRYNHGFALIRVTD